MRSSRPPAGTSSLANSNCAGETDPDGIIRDVVSKIFLPLPLPISLLPSTQKQQFACASKAAYLLYDQSTMSEQARGGSDQSTRNGIEMTQVNIDSERQGVLLNIPRTHGRFQQPNPGLETARFSVIDATDHDSRRNSCSLTLSTIPQTPQSSTRSRASSMTTNLTVPSLQDSDFDSVDGSDNASVRSDDTILQDQANWPPGWTIEDELDFRDSIHLDGEDGDGDTSMSSSTSSLYTRE